MLISKPIQVILKCRCYMFNDFTATKTCSRDSVNLDMIQATLVTGHLAGLLLFRALTFVVWRGYLLFGGDNSWC